jgi:hypothetical protein
MVLSKATVAELNSRKEFLDRESQRLDRERAEIERERTAIEVIIGQEKAADPLLRLRPRTRAGHTGLREAIRELLRAHPEGLRSRDIAEKLTEVGFSNGRPSALRARVSGEVHRLVKKEEALPTANKRYVWSKKD